MSWDHGTLQPWMNVIASFVHFSFQSYPELPTKWGQCVAVCWRTPCYPHLDLRLNKTTIGSVFIGFISFSYGTHLTVLSTLWIPSLPLPLKIIGSFLSPPAPLSSHPSFSPHLFPSKSHSFQIDIQLTDNVFFCLLFFLPFFFRFISLFVLSFLVPPLIFSFIEEIF